MTRHGVRHGYNDVITRLAYADMDGYTARGSSSSALRRRRVSGSRPTLTLRGVAVRKRGCDRPTSDLRVEVGLTSDFREKDQG
jgi:hypothetical protein